MTKPILHGGISRWIVMLPKFDLKVLAEKSIRGRVVSDFLTDHPTNKQEENYDVIDEDIHLVEVEAWELYS